MALKQPRDTPRPKQSSSRLRAHNWKTSEERAGRATKVRERARGRGETARRRRTQRWLC